MVCHSVQVFITLNSVILSSVKTTMVIGTTSAKGQKHSERTKTEHKQIHLVLLLVNIDIIQSMLI